MEFWNFCPGLAFIKKQLLCYQAAEIPGNIVKVLTYRNVMGSSITLSGDNKTRGGYPRPAHRPRGTTVLRSRQCRSIALQVVHTG